MSDTPAVYGFARRILRSIWPFKYIWNYKENMMKLWSLLKRTFVMRVETLSIVLRGKIWGKFSGFYPSKELKIKIHIEMSP